MAGAPARAFSRLSSCLGGGPGVASPAEPSGDELPACGLDGSLWDLRGPRASRGGCSTAPHPANPQLTSGLVGHTGLSLEPLGLLLSRGGGAAGAGSLSPAALTCPFSAKSQHSEYPALHPSPQDTALVASSHHPIEKSQNPRGRCCYCHLFHRGGNQGSSSVVASHTRQSQAPNPLEPVIPA